MPAEHRSRLLRDERGATAIEYGLIAALIVVAIMAGLNTFSSANIEMYNKVSTAIDNVIT